MMQYSNVLRTHCRRRRLRFRVGFYLREGQRQRRNAFPTTWAYYLIDLSGYAEFGRALSK